MNHWAGCLIRNGFRQVLALIFSASGAAAAAAQTSAQVPALAPPQIPSPLAARVKGVSLAQIPRVRRPPRLADFLENRPREAELKVTDFRQYQPGDGVPATETTQAYLSYDDKNLYVVFVCHDEPGGVFAHLSKREDLDQDDGVAVLLDTFRDFHRAYYFFSNPLGIQADAIYTEGQGYDFSFDTLWDTGGRLTADGYIVRFAIPFKSLRFSHDPEQTWGVALYRVILRKSEYDYWPYVTQRVQGITQQFAPVGELEKISPGRNIQFIPYGLLAYNHFLDQTNLANPSFRDVFEHRAGLDAKFVAKDALTFDVTLNPDFSQVESDDPQVTINQRFAVFFPEKRPFFIENAGFFQTPINLFFSRQIADPQFGARMTGKINHWLLGTLVIDDRQPGLNQASPFNTRAVDGVFRVAREFGDQSQIGAFFSTHDFADISNRVASLDARLKFSKSWVLDLQAAHSWTRQDSRLPQLCQEFNPNAQGVGSQQGSAYWANLSYSGRHWVFGSNYDDKTPGFCTELGFVNRVDVRQNSTFVGYYWRPQHRRLIAFGPSASELLDWEHVGRLQDWQAVLGFRVDFTRQTTLTFSRGEAYELFENISFRKHSTAAAVVSQPYKWLMLSGRYSWGVGENFFPPAGINPFLGNTQRVNAGFTIRPSARFRFDETYIYSRLGTRTSSTAPPFAPGLSVFNNHLMRSRLNYQFTKEFSLRLIVDYDATLANPSLLDLQTNLGSFDGGPVAPAKKLTGDVLFTYLLHPGTAVYVGYTDGYTNLQVNNLLVPPIIATGSPTTSTGRLFFVKVSYLFRY